MLTTLLTLLHVRIDQVPHYFSLLLVAVALILSDGNNCLTVTSRKDDYKIYRWQRPDTRMAPYSIGRRVKDGSPELLSPAVTALYMARMVYSASGHCIFICMVLNISTKCWRMASTAAL